MKVEAFQAKDGELFLTEEDLNKYEEDSSLRYHKDIFKKWYASAKISFTANKWDVDTDFDEDFDFDKDSFDLKGDSVLEWIWEHRRSLFVFLNNVNQVQDFMGEQIKYSEENKT